MQPHLFERLVEELLRCCIRLVHHPRRVILSTYHHRRQVLASVRLLRVASSVAELCRDESLEGLKLRFLLLIGVSQFNLLKLVQHFHD